jgi:hypothetical protein
MKESFLTYIFRSVAKNEYSFFFFSLVDEIIIEYSLFDLFKYVKYNQKKNSNDEIFNSIEIRRLRSFLHEKCAHMYQETSS